MSEIYVSPSILAADFSKLDKECLTLQQCGADWIHFDVMDGKFVPNTTFDWNTVAAMRKVVSLPFDVHLMIESPELTAEKYIKAGADLLTFHYEACKDCKKLARFIRSKGVKVGISIKPKTSVEEIVPLLDEVDMVLVMSVEPGFGGQKFMPSALDKLKELRFLKKDLLLEVDGGVTPQNVDDVISAGANCIVAGSAVFKAENKAQTIASLRGR